MCYSKKKENTVFVHILEEGLDPPTQTPELHEGVLFVSVLVVDSYTERQNLGKLVDTIHCGH